MFLENIENVFYINLFNYFQPIVKLDNKKLKVEADSLFENQIQFLKLKSADVSLLLYL